MNYCCSTTSAKGNAAMYAGMATTDFAMSRALKVVGCSSKTVPWSKALLNTLCLETFQWALHIDWAPEGANADRDMGLLLDHLYKKGSCLSGRRRLFLLRSAFSRCICWSLWNITIARDIGFSMHRKAPSGNQFPSLALLR